MSSGSKPVRPDKAIRPPLQAVDRRDDERAYLYRIIQTIGSGPDLETILRGVVHLATEATGCHACLIWFAERDRLVLRASSPPYATLAGTVSVRVGEGLVGWVARTRRSAFIRENALDDPRVKYFPEFEEEEFQSLVSVPMFERDGEVMGVISLHAVAPHEFGRADLDFLEHTASLIAGAVENARLYERTADQVDLLHDLSGLSQRIASAASVSEVLGAVTEGVDSLLQGARAEIYLLEPDERLHLAAARPPRADAAALDPVSPRWQPPGDGPSITTPLLVGDQRIGLLAVQLREAEPEADTVLAAVAAHAAVAIRQHQVIASLQEKTLVKDFFHALVADGLGTAVGDLAERLGIDLDAPHLVLHVVEASGTPAPEAGRAAGTSPSKRPAWRTSAASAEVRLAARFRGSLFDHHERTLRAIVPIAYGDASTATEAIRNLPWADERAHTLSVGVSNPCLGAESFTQGFHEAASAAEVGALMRGGAGVSTYDELGPYRYVLHSDPGQRDRLQQALQLIVDYDARRGTRLLDTLEGYMDHRGNVVATSRALFIHPNTLRQRLDRIEQVSGLALEADDWLSLAVALKVVKLHMLRTQHVPAEREPRDG